MDQCNGSANGRPIDTPGWRTRHTRHWTPVRITHTQRSARKDECMLQTLLACSPTSLDAGIPQKAKRPRPADGSTRSFDGLRRPDERTGTHRQRYPSSTGACSPGGKKRNGQRPPAACGPWPRSFLGCAAGWDDGANKRGIGQPDASDLRRRKLHQRATRARIPADKGAPAPPLSTGAAAASTRSRLLWVERLLTTRKRSRRKERTQSYFLRTRRLAGIAASLGVIVGYRASK